VDASERVVSRPTIQGGESAPVHSADLVVLGAGPAGLAAAWRAARKGLSVVVLERGDSVGGMAASFEVAGFRVDHGSHRLHPAIPQHLLGDLRRLLGDNLQARPRRGRVRVAGTWISFPLKPAEAARAMPGGMLARAAWEAVAAPGRSAHEDTYADVLRAGLGPTLYDSLYGPYATKLWGLPGEQIDGDQARKRVAADTPWKVARRMLRVRSGGASGPGHMFYYPRRGFGQIVEALADAAADAGADIRLGSTAQTIEPGEGDVDEPGPGPGVRVDVLSQRSIQGRHVFSTVPIPVLAQIARPGPPLNAIEAATRLQFRAMVLVYVVHYGGRWTPFDAHYLPDLATPIARISEPANYRISPDDPDDRTVLCCEIPCSVGDEVWEASDDELAAIVEDGLARTGLPPVKLGWVQVKRLRHVYPIYQVGYRDYLHGLDEWAGTVPGVTTFGRLGLFAHDNTHHALAMAYDAADALGPSGFDERAWAQARERFAHHVVED
jgi:protoporphyrinogen oxidase